MFKFKIGEEAYYGASHVTVLNRTQRKLCNNFLRNQYLIQMPQGSSRWVPEYMLYKFDARPPDDKPFKFDLGAEVVYYGVKYTVAGRAHTRLQTNQYKLRNANGHALYYIPEDYIELFTDSVLEYEVLKPLTVISIQQGSPCKAEFNELVKDVLDQDYRIDEEIPLSVLRKIAENRKHEGLGWLEDHGYIRKTMPPEPERTYRVGDKFRHLNTVYMIARTGAKHQCQLINMHGDPWNPGRRICVGKLMAITQAELDHMLGPDSFKFTYIDQDQED